MSKFKLEMNQYIILYPSLLAILSSIDIKSIFNIENTFGYCYQNIKKKYENKKNMKLLKKCITKKTIGILIFIILIILFFSFLNMIISKTQFISTIEKDNGQYIDLYLNDDINMFLKYSEEYQDFYEKQKEVYIGDYHEILKNEELKTLGINQIDGNDKSKMVRYEDNRIIKFNDSNYNVSGFITWQTKNVDFKLNAYDKNGKYLNEKIEKKYKYLKVYINNTNAIDYLNNLRNHVKKIENKNFELFHYKIMAIEHHYNHIVWNKDIYIMYKGIKKNLEELEDLYIKTFFHEQKDILWQQIKEIDQNPETILKLGQSPRIGLLLHGPPGTGKSSFAYRIARSLNRHIYSIDLKSITRKTMINELLRRPLVGEESQRRIQPKEIVYVFDEFDISVRHLYNKKMRNIELMKNASEPISVNAHEIELEDLLEIFQGPVPIEGSIIIATTNKFYEISKMLPALFSTGRLTPIYFGNITIPVLNQICNYYYNKECNYNISNNIMPSQLLNIAIESKLPSIKNSFEYFLNNLVKYFNVSI